MYGQQVAPLVGRCMTALPLGPLPSSILQPPGSFFAFIPEWKNWRRVQKNAISTCVNLKLRISSDASVPAFYFAALFREKQQGHAYARLKAMSTASFGAVVITTLRVPQITGSNPGLVILTGYRHCGLYPPTTPRKFCQF